MNQSLIPQMPQFAFFALLAWSFFWKGLALWKAAKNSQKIWFVTILLINLFGALEILYLFVFARKKMQLSELKFWE